MEGQTATAADTTNEGSATASVSVTSTKTVLTSRQNLKILNKLEKLTRQEGNALSKRAKNILREWDDYQHFVTRLDEWYSRNEKRYIRYLSIYGREFLTETEFKLALKDLQVPFNDLEKEVLYCMLDPKKTGQVDYSRLYEAIWTALASRFYMEDELKKMDLEPPDNWLLVTFKIPSCEPVDTQTTFEHLVTVEFTGHMLREIIQLRLPKLPSRSIVIFTDPTHYTETAIQCNQRLYELSFIGGPKCAPQEATLYYEYTMGRVDCPLICPVNHVEIADMQDTEPRMTQDTLTW